MTEELCNLLHAADVFVDAATLPHDSFQAHQQAVTDAVEGLKTAAILYAFTHGTAE